MGWLADETGLEKNAANYAPLTPLMHLRRAAMVFPDYTALVDRSTRRTYTEYADRVTRLASALTRLGVTPGDVVATLLPNVAPHAEATFAVPATGAIINTINTRLDTDTVAYIFDHGAAKVVLVDASLIGLAEAASEAMEGTPPTIIEVADDEAGLPASGKYQSYEDLVASGDPDWDWVWPQDEWESLALNYTSGTTGRPKGVVYHHRGAYLNTMAQVISLRMTLFPKFLTVVPLFHCNGWCHPWMIPVLGGTLVCCRTITAKAIYDAIADEGVTNFGGAPIVLNSIINCDDADRREFSHTVDVITAGAPPPAATLEAIEPLGFNVMQVYGLTETYGPATECMWHAKWDDLPKAERYEIKARTGIPMAMVDDCTVLDPETMEQVPMDGATTGEIMYRGNGVMKGYYKNPEASAKDFAGGWFHTGDVAFQHPDGYCKITDRSKDIIISGGENISSIEVEGVLMRHPAVSLVAVVAKPDDKWGEVPCAFIELKPGQTPTEAEIIAFARERLAGFKTPKKIVFTELPKTSTGKIQKFHLRDDAKAM